MMNPTIIINKEFLVTPAKILISFCSFLQLKKLQICIKTKVVKMKVKCLEGTMYFSIGS